MKSNIKQMWELAETVKIHHAYMQEIVKTLNQMMDDTKAIKDFINLLVQRINEAEDDIMEIARKVYNNPLAEPLIDNEDDPF